MRKTLIVVLTLICALCASGTFYAAAEVLTENSQSVNIEVAADYVENTSDPKRLYCDIADGKASVVTAEGAAIAVSGIQADGLTLVVLPITESETEAWEWFEGCLEDYGTNIYPMDIYFIDGNGNRVEYNGNFSVSITAPDQYTDPGIFYLDTDGKVTEISCTAEGKTVAFETDRDSYYVLAEKAPQTPGGSDLPSTGDTGRVCLWGVLLFVSGAALVGAAAIDRRKRYSK